MISKVFKFIFKSIYGISAILGFFIILGGLFGLYISSQAPKKPQVHEGTLLTLTLQGEFPDYVRTNPIKRLLKGEENSLYELITTLDRASKDSKIKGLVMNIKLPGMGLAQVQEFRDAVLRFKVAGKSTLIYSDTYGEMNSALIGYYLASAFDEIWMQPIGMVNISGLAFEQPYAREALDKIGVSPEFGGLKEYKSFIEMYTNTGPSEPAKEASQAMLDSITSQIVEALAKSRKMTPDQVMDIINKSPYTDLEARDLKLVDNLIHRQSIKPVLEARYGEKNPVHFMDFWSYEDATHPEKAHTNEDHIAIIFDSGAIMPTDEDQDGLMDEELISSSRTYHNFMDVLKNSEVKGIVYRISSPGGSPVASETIASIIHHAKAQNVPVIVSMGDYAASGGYWVSVEGTKIFAEPFTLTGSIGVFTGKFVLKDLWAKIGINWDGPSFGLNSGLASSNKSFTAEEWSRVNASLERIYSAFVNKVAHARKLSPEAAEKAAKGRVWTGEQAQSLGLVDQLGGLHDAIIAARKEAGLSEDAPTVIYPRKKPFLEAFMDKLMGSHADEHEAIETGFSAPYKYWKVFQSFVSQLRLLMHSEVLEAPMPQVR